MGVARGEDSIDQTLVLVRPIRLQQGDYLAPIETVRLGLLGSCVMDSSESPECVADLFCPAGWVDSVPKTGQNNSADDFR